MERLRNRLVVGAVVLLVGWSLATAQSPDPHPGASQPVRELNVDGSGAIRVHEQGVADVNVTNLPLPVTGTVDIGNSSLDVNVLGGSINANITGGSLEATAPPATAAFSQLFVIPSGDPAQAASFAQVNATTIHARSENDSEAVVWFRSPLAPGVALFSLGNSHFAALGKGEFVTFAQPVPLNEVVVLCFNASSDCRVEVVVVGQ